MRNGLIINVDGTKNYYLNDQFHRDDGPASEWVNGDKIWYKNGTIHREDGPAFEITARKEWYFYGELHRIDGPAIECDDGAKYWYLYGERINCKTQEEFLRLMKLKMFW